VGRSGEEQRSREMAHARNRASPAVAVGTALYDKFSRYLFFWRAPRPGQDGAFIVKVEPAPGRGD